MEYVAEQRHNIITIERPITPPTEDEQVPSRGMATPRAVTPLVHNPGLTVPGQPRKTPGAKHRHAVAAPETVDAVNDDVFLDQQTVQNAQRQAERALKDRNRDKSRSREPSVILVEAKEEDVPMIVDAVIVSRNPAKENEAPQTFVRTASGLRQMTPPVVIDGHGVINHSAVVSINAPASPAKQAVSSRIAKSRQQRPLTIINDNRQADVTAYSEHASRTTGKSQSNVLDAAEGSGIMSSGERYNLRTGRLSNPLTAHTGLAANNNQATRLQQNGQIRPAPRHTTASPTRLPQRIPPAKAGNAPSHQPTGRRVSSRKAAAVSAAKTTENLTAGTKQGSNVKPVVSVTSAAPVTSRPATGLGRAPRRRRSSTGDV
ncbi:cell division control protein 14 [Cystobasidiomycetes sp. EMM_F5]